MRTYRKKVTESRDGSRWYRMDLHLHTPASADHREPKATYHDFLKRAEAKGLDIVGFADHNTVAGFAQYISEFESLELLERLNRITPEERERLSDFRRLREKLLILPGFEFTATLGFHVLGFFSPDTPVRKLEHLLLNLRVPADRLDEGSTECGATSDVLTAYRLIDEAGGIVIAAHANSSHGVAMPGFDFGGQTRIAYTQDSHLHALEVTDFGSRSRRRTQTFFSGTKPEYPRTMHIVQSSDAHRLLGIPGNNQELGIGDRATEIQLPELTFDAIKAVFRGNDFARTRPYVATAKQVYDPILECREEGETLVQSFHEHLWKSRAIDPAILEDVVALANTNGGTIYIGLNANPRTPVAGVERPSEAASRFREQVLKSIVPPLEVEVDAQKSSGKSILRIIVPRGSEVPYALDGSYIYIRTESETNLAVRDEIIQLVREALSVEFAALAPPPERLPEVERAESAPPSISDFRPALATTAGSAASEPSAPFVAVGSGPPTLTAAPPHTGVEVVHREVRKGTPYYTIRDLRNNRAVHNITRSSARKLWQYAISEYEDHPLDPRQVNWTGPLGLVKAHKRAGKIRYDLVERGQDGKLYTYYGVTEDGIHGAWRNLIGPEQEQAAQDQPEEEAENGTPAFGDRPAYDEASGLEPAGGDPLKASWPLPNPSEVALAFGWRPADRSLEGTELASPTMPFPAQLEDHSSEAEPAEWRPADAKPAPSASYSLLGPSAALAAQPFGGFSEARVDLDAVELAAQDGTALASGTASAGSVSSDTDLSQVPIPPAG